jgi:rod shape-determining protein MreD
VSVALLAAGLALAALGTLVLGALRVPQAPDLFLLPVAASARQGGSIRAMFTGLAAGFLQDAFAVPARLYGLNAFSKVLVGYLLAAVCARTLIERPALAGALLGIAAFVDTAVVTWLLWVVRGELLVPSPGALAVRIGATAVVGAALHALARQPWKERWAARRRRLGR